MSTMPSPVQDLLRRALPPEMLAMLVRRIADGEQAALAELYDATVRKLLALSALIVRNSQDAEEVVCDTFVQVWHSAQRYDPARGSALAWLLIICRSRALDRLRRNRRMLAVSPVSADEFSEARPDDLLQVLEQDSAIYRALARLPPLRLRLISYAFLQGLTHEEIARTTSLPVGTVKSHIRRALAAMRSELGERYDGAR